MYLGTNCKTYTRYIVKDREDGKEYGFDTLDGAVRWARELVEDFDTMKEDVSVSMLTYDNFGNIKEEESILGKDR